MGVAHKVSDHHITSQESKTTEKKLENFKSRIC
jgi:hypothetical protein